MQSTNTFELARYGADLQRRIYDMPIGDPMSGAPYGEYLKSKGLGMVIGVVASIVTMGAAMPMLSSVYLATQLAGGVMMAGGVLSGVGALTGNKKLAKIGGIMSLAGGLGAMASNLTGGFGLGVGSEAVSNMANSFMDSASSVSGGMLYGERIAGEAAANAADAFKTNAGTLSLSDSATNVSLSGAGAGGGGEPVIQSASAPETLTIEGKAPVPQVEAGKTATNLPLDQTPSVQSSSFLDNGPNPGSGRGGFSGNPSAPATEKGLFSKAGDFISENKELFKVGAGFLEKSMGAGDTAAAEDAKNAEALSQAKVYDAQAALLGTQNSQAQFQLANQNKKSVMISADDPNFEQLLAQAKADGAAIGIIPSIGSGGIKQTGAPAFNATNGAQQVVRQPTFKSPTPQPMQRTT
jgi:hypothetical protein